MYFIKRSQWFLVACSLLLSLNGFALAADSAEQMNSNPTSTQSDAVQNSPENAAKTTASCNFYTDDCISSYEPNTVGVTKDRHNEPFLDYKLSVMYPFFHSFHVPFIGTSDSTITLLAVNVRFAQFINEPSAPVIGMRYNPKLVFRTMVNGTPKGEYLHYWEISGGHESNGQTISSPEQYDIYLAQVNGKRELADDAISRGWDNLELKWGLENRQFSPDSLDTYTIIGQFKYFVRWGVLEGHKEEYQSWENDPDGKPRDKVNGVKILTKYVYNKTLKFTAIFETGYHPVGTYISRRFEFAGKFFKNIPIMVWISDGYNANGDLAAYYRRFESYGIALDLGSF